MWRAYMTTTVLEAATQTLAGSVGTYVTVLQAQSNRFRSRMQRSSVSQGLLLTERNSLVANAAASEGDNSAKFIVIGFLEERPRVNLRNEEDQRSMLIRDPAVKISPHVDFCPLFWVPVPNHQVGGHDGVCEALAKRLEHVLSRFESLGVGRLNHRVVRRRWATRAHGNGLYILVRPLTSPPPSPRTRQPQVNGPGSTIDPGNKHELG